jgi:hypothetical protein
MHAMQAPQRYIEYSVYSQIELFPLKDNTGTNNNRCNKYEQMMKPQRSSIHTKKNSLKEESHMSISLANSGLHH